MFLSRVALEDEDPHELDFRFEVVDDGGYFVFVHHGLNLADLAETIDLGQFGSAFYMIRARYPFTTPDIAADPRIFSERYGFEPQVVAGKYLRFDASSLHDFFRASWTNDDDQDIDCEIVGASRELSDEELRQIFDHMAQPTPLVAQRSGMSVIAVHDNHFVYIEATQLSLLRGLVEQSIVGFFNTVYPTRFASIPDALIDLIINEYHTASLVCLPVEWDDTKMDVLPTGNTRTDDTGIHVLIETSQSHWTSYDLDIPQQMLGRRLLISYDPVGSSWSLDAGAR